MGFYAEQVLPRAVNEIETIRNYYLKGPKSLGYMYAGRARNP